LNRRPKLYSTSLYIHKLTPRKRLAAIFKTANPTSFNIPTTTGNFSSDNSTAGFHSIAYSTILPQYSNTSNNNSQSFDENVTNNGYESIVYTPTANDYSGGDDNSDDNDDSSSSNPDHSKHNHDSNSNTNNDNGDDDDKKDSDKTKSHTIKHSKSLKVEKIKHAPNNLKSEGHHKNLNKYIHNVVKERLDRMTERLLE
jgi:hypothetical protein